MKTNLQILIFTVLIIVNSQNSFSNETSDSLPAGVTKEWLNKLTDENGKPIIPDEDPEGDALQRKTFNGLAVNSQFGYSVSSAGDVNGDGFDDVIVGAYGYSSSIGRAYVYYGGVNMNTIADVTLSGVLANNFFGYSVSSAGDVNGDGFSDIVVGAYGYSSNTGRAYIYFGGASMNNSVDVIMTGETTGNFFGISVSSGGDVNGDGYGDVIVGANSYSSNTGRSYIFFGGAAMNNFADVTMTGEAANNSFGTSVAAAGDVNGDGYSDVIIGANGYSSNTGRAYIYLGGNSMNNVSDNVMSGESAGNNFGFSVSSGGDVNGDGFSDVIIGAYGRNASKGNAYVYFGGAIMNSTSDLTMNGEAANNEFGISVSSAGDINGDGYSDILVGADGFNSLQGKAYIYFGGISADTLSDVTIDGGKYFGHCVSSAGDVNGDGYSDIIVGSHGETFNTGKVYLYDYFMKNEIIPELTITGTASNYLGVSVSAGDFNADGYPDIIAGAPGYNSNTGRAFIYFGGAVMDNTADVILTGEAIGTSFGSSVSSAGDVNGDGYSDVIIGAKGYNSDLGRTYIYYGGTSMDNISDVILTGVSTVDFGTSVSTAGDVNGDGYSDVLVGADGFFNVRGKVFIYLGGNSMDNVSDVTMLGDSIYSYIGNSVSSAGDVNGDGYSDVIIGNQSFNSYYKRGEAYIFFGGAVMNNVKDVTLFGEAADNLFGCSVASAGDINNDGFSDVIAGATGYNAGSGRAYIFYGGNLMDAAADVTFTGEYSSNFGNSVSSAGDINGDGYSDVIVGAVAYSSSKGKSYIFYGGIYPDNTADVVMTGDDASSFGRSVALVGDLNSDGYSDVIVSADNYNTNTGRVYAYTGSVLSVKPILLSVKDVPYDQGGYVDLKWARSSYDVNGSAVISDYIVERSLPPSGGNFAWVTVAVIPAIKNSFYSFLASTPFDSGSNTPGTFFFRITARTYIPSPNWHSAILSGRSIDNIAPLMLSPFTATKILSNVRLNWNISTAPDLLNYILYRNTAPTIDPQTEPPFATLSDTTYLDTSPLSGVFYYFVVAQDIHNNKSPVATVMSPNSQKLLLFGAIQGFYNPETNTEIHDTVRVYLRNSTAPYAIVDSSKKLLFGPGTGQEFTFSNGQNNTPYYIIVRHRNSIETWSADPVTFLSDNASIAYSVNSIYAYGNNEIKVDDTPYDVYAFYSGDVNQDGVIDATDNSAIDNDAYNFLTGYVPTDLTGDDFVDASDASIADNNAANFVAIARP